VKNSGLLWHAAWALDTTLLVDKNPESKKKITHQNHIIILCHYHTSQIYIRTKEQNKR